MPASRVAVADGRVTGVAAGEETFAADAVISTVPTPLVPRLAPDLPDTFPGRLGRWFTVAAPYVEMAGFAGLTTLVAAPIYGFAPRFDRWFTAFTRTYERLLHEDL